MDKAHVQHIRLPKDHFVSQCFLHTAEARAEMELKSITGVYKKHVMTMKMQWYVCIVLFFFICKTHTYSYTDCSLNVLYEVDRSD